MSESQLIKIGMASWPWPERPPLEMGVESGIVWAITRAPYMGINGYVMIPPEGHPWSAGIPSWPQKYDEDDEYSYEAHGYDAFTVHGGITYGGGECMGSDQRWLGFDTAHSGDVWPPEFDPHNGSDICGRGLPWSKEWTTELVIEEVKSLARQLAAVEVDTRAIEVGDQ